MTDINGPAEMRRACGILFEPEQVVELRALKTPKGTLSGYFNRHDFLAATAEAHDGLYNLFWTLNEVRPDLIARKENGLEPYCRTTTSDAEIVRRRWLLIDGDPKRPTGISSTEAEHDAALNRVQAVKAYLTEQGWADPVEADSGNGGHLLYGIDLANDEASATLLSELLTGLAAKFDDDMVELDKTVFNAARIVKLYGTMAVKGSSTELRPHRRSHLTRVPDQRLTVPLERIQAVALALTPAIVVKPVKASAVGTTGAQRPSAKTGTMVRSWSMADFISKHGIVVNHGPMAWKGGEKWQIDCPFNTDHVDKDAFIAELADGHLVFSCSHNSCSHNKWQEFRRLYEPDAYDQPQRRSQAPGQPQDARSADLDAELTARSLDDFGLADRLTARYGVDLRYCEAEATWYVWDGQVWERQQTASATIRKGELTVDAMRREVDTILVKKGEDGKDKNEQWREIYRSFAKSSRSRRKVNDMVALAQTRLDIQARPRDFDNNPWFLTCANGTLDLQHGILRAHDRADMLTQAIPVVYDPTAACPLWVSFLTHVLPKQEVRDYLQKFLGYSLTGLTREQCFLFLLGPGANGKGTVVDTVGALMGELHNRLDAEVIAHTAISSGKARFGLGGIVGRRLVTFSELEEKSRFNEALLKSLTGEDPIEIELKGKTAYSYQPRAKYILAGNHKPAITGTDHGIWRRTRLIPFVVTIPDEQQDETLRAQLIGELPGILNWALAGLAAYQTQGLKAPAAVLDATKEYREDSDVLGQFIDQACVTGDTQKAKAKELYTAYKMWCEENGHHPLAQNSMGSRLKQRGFDNVHTQFGSVWQRLGIKADYIEYDSASPVVSAAAERFTKGVRTQEAAFQDSAEEPVDWQQ